MKISIMLFLSCTTVFTAAAQNLSVFSDYRDYFYVFDDGMIKELEYLPVQSYQIGGICVAYVDNTDNFKVYYQGEVFKPEHVPVDKYFATDYLVAYTLGQQLKVFDNGKSKILTFQADCYVISDSIIAFCDRLTKFFKVYYNGEITILEDGVAGPPLKNIKIGDNILAYIDYSNYFKIFYRGNTIELADLPLRYKAGKNTVAYVDGSSLAFKVFYKNNIYELEVFQPKSFKVADDMVAYIDDSGTFKVFYDGGTTTISSFEPDFYKVKDNIIVYSEQTIFKVFNKGKSHTLENYIPVNYQLDYNTVVWIDQQDNLKSFYGGQVKTLTEYEKLNKFELSGNTIMFNTGINTNKISYKGQIYE